MSAFLQWAQQCDSGMPHWVALLIAAFNPGTLLTLPLLFPKRWFSPTTDGERRELKKYSKYDPAIHGEIG